MGGSPASQDEDALVAERLKSATDLQMVAGTGGGLHRHLNDRDVGGGIHEAQGHPGAVIEPSFFIQQTRVEPGELQEMTDGSGELGRARSGIAHLQELSENPPKSWMVGGRGWAVTRGRGDSPCAETHTIAFGRGSVRPSSMRKRGGGSSFPKTRLGAPGHTNTT